MKKELNGISMKSIAQYANVSTATVSRVLRAPSQVRESSRTAVFQSMKELGIPMDEFYAPDDESDMPLILILNRATDDNLTSRHILRNIYEVIGRNNYLAVCMDPFAMQFPFHGALLGFIRENNVKGVLTLVRLDEAVLESIAKIVPLIQVGDTNVCAQTNIVSTDYFAAARKMVNYLLSHGCKNIACVLTDTAMSDSSARKYRGYLAALHDGGIDPQPSCIAEIPKVDYNAAFSVVASLLKRDPLPDAIFCGTDVFAAAAISACHKVALAVPDDVMVTGFDDSIIASMTTPKITSVRTPDLGYMSTEILFDNIAHPDRRFEKILMDADMIIRGSTK